MANPALKPLKPLQSTLVKTDSMKPYNDWLYLYPPRPEFVIPPDRIDYYEKQGWAAQYKKNGTNSVIGYSPDGKFTLMDRHKGPQKAWSITTHIKDVLSEILPKNKWTYLIAELLHNKTPTIKDTLYFHDILVLDSTYLLGTTYEQRQKWLAELFPSNVEAYSHYLITEKIWRAKLLTKDLTRHFQSIKEPKIDEGLVLKRPSGFLKMCDTPKSNSSWLLKCRYPTKIYNY